MNAPTGDQYLLTRGDARAVITQLAASLREFSIGGIDITEPYSEDSLPPSGDGIVLVPWPNRVADGKWVLDGKTLQLDITEVDKNNALHGLLRNTGYSLVERTPESVTLAATVFPQHGYPFLLDSTVKYELVDDGLDITHSFVNRSSAKAPVAVGTHPFFTIGDVPTDQLELTVHASTYFDVDARLNPLAELPVDGTRFDLREGKRVGDLDLDTAFGGVTTRDGVSAVLRASDGREVRLLQDDRHGFVQVYTTQIFPKKGDRGWAVAIEPMTAPPNAFNSGQGLEWVEPGSSWSVGWGIRYGGF